MAFSVKRGVSHAFDSISLRDTELVGYSPEFREAIESSNADKINGLLTGADFRDHLRGVRLNLCTSDSTEANFGKYKIVSTPLLDLIRKFPDVASMVFYRLMLLKSSHNLMEFSKFEPSQMFQVSSLDFDYELFDHLAAIRNWHKENKAKHHLVTLSNRDLSRLHPLAVICKTKARNLYQHPYVKEYTFLKFRQYKIYYLLIINLILTW